MPNGDLDSLAALIRREREAVLGSSANGAARCATSSACFSTRRNCAI